MSKFPSLFPSLFVRMTKVGEESGTLGDTFLYLTEFYEGDIDEATKNLSTLLEPFLLVAIGLMVGTVALSIVSPIYGIVSSI
jgi:type II secretory pathway component PulF